MKLEDEMQLRAERDALKAELDHARAVIERVEADAAEQQKNAGTTDDRWKLGVYAQASRTRNILRDALDAPPRPEDTRPTGGIQTFAADVVRLVRDYSSEERGVIALMPFEATLDQLCLEKYGFDLDKVTGPEDTRTGISAGGDEQ